MLSKDPIRIAGPLGRIYSFTRHYKGNDFFEGPRLAFHHDRAYARDHLLRLTRSVVDDPFNYRLLDVWQLVFQKPWTRPRDVNQLIADLTDKIHRGELFVYLEPDLERDLPSLLRDGPPEGDGGFVDIGVLGYPADTPRTQDPVIITGSEEPQDAPLTHAVPQGEPATNEVSALGYAVGAAELAAKGIWNGLVEVGAGLSGLGTVLLTGDGAAGAAVVEGIKEQYGSELKTKGAEAIGEAVAPVFEKYEAGKEYLGELGMSQDSPGLATALYTAPDAVLSVAGGFLGRGAVNSTRNAGARGLDGSVVPNNARTYAHNMVDNPGPLASLPNNPAANFAGGKYNTITLEDDLILYRAGEGGGGRNALGQWFTREPAESVAQVRIDLAVKPQWKDADGVLTGSSPVESVYQIKIPKGTTVYEGPVGNQGGIYLGGQDVMQIYVNQPWNIKGVQVLDEMPIGGN